MLKDIPLYYQLKFEKATYGIKPFKCYGIHIWNLLLYELKESVDILSFKTLIMTWVCHTCQCNMWYVYFCRLCTYHIVFFKKWLLASVYCFFKFLIKFSLFLYTIATIVGCISILELSNDFQLSSIQHNHTNISHLHVYEIIYTLTYARCGDTHFINQSYEKKTDL